MSDRDGGQIAAWSAMDLPIVAKNTENRFLWGYDGRLSRLCGWPDPSGGGGVPGVISLDS